MFYYSVSKDNKGFQYSVIIAKKLSIYSLFLNFIPF